MGALCSCCRRRRGGRPTVPKRAEREKLPLLTNAEWQHMMRFHASICYKHQELGCTRRDLTVLWSRHFDHFLVSFVLEYYFGHGVEGVHVREFAKFFVNITRGSIDEKAEIFRKVLAPRDPDPKFAPSDIYLFVVSVVRSYLKHEMHGDGIRPTSWRNVRCPQHDNAMQMLAESLCFQVITDRTFVTLTELEHWIVTWPARFSFFLSSVLAEMFDMEADIFSGNEDISTSLLPLCVMHGSSASTAQRGVAGPPEAGMPTGRHRTFPSVVDVPSVVHVNMSLPRPLRSQWRLLFTTVEHGVSYTKLVERIANKGPTVLIVQDATEHVFGGFASDSWDYSDSFRGDFTCFLFTLSPRMRVYESSGRNNRYQQLTMAGLGLGGSPGYHGLFVAGDLSRGHSSARCPTFRDYRPLSSERDFNVVRLEVWGVGPAPQKQRATRAGHVKPPVSLVCDPDTHSSIGRSNLDAPSLLTMAGVRRYSDGLRRGVGRETIQQLYNTGQLADLEEDEGDSMESVTEWVHIS
ncbi:MTOR-associated protein MEAK7-like [Schistocerca cancellata]|uniref:MTOR-associated protein MEAK7-like n=1 Tax=Schistocerca cancellata TaxID=274614 RepID=UPI002117724F|nr:MTOR-associated protein MEAK7-like [Schistocerca cancellata]